MATNVFWSPNNPQLVFPSAVADIRYQLQLGPPPPPTAARFDRMPNDPQWRILSSVTWIWYCMRKFQVYVVAKQNSLTLDLPMGAQLRFNHYNIWYLQDDVALQIEFMNVDRSQM